MNQKTLILIFTIVISFIFGIYIFSNESVKDNEGSLMHFDHEPIEDIKILNRGQDKALLRPGYEKIGRLQFKKIESWTRKDPSSKMRIAEYQINSKKNKAELVVFSGIGGTPDQNINRWYNQFKTDSKYPNLENLKKWNITSNGYDINFVYCEGTYLKSNMMMSKVEDELANYGLLGAIITGAHEPYYFKMIGPNFLIKSQRKLFEDFIGSVWGL